MDFRSLRVRILSLFLLSFLGAGAVVALVLAGSLQRDVESLLARQQGTFVGGLAEELDQKIKLQIEAMERVAPLVLRVGDDVEALTGFIEDRTGIRGFFGGGLLVLGADGLVRAETPALGRLGEDMAGTTGIGPVLATGRSLVGEPYFDHALEQPAVAFAVPIRRGDAVVGALVGIATLTQSNLLGRLVEQKVGESGGLYMVSPKSGLIVVSTNKERIFTPAPLRGQNHMLDRYMDGFEGSGVTVSSAGLEELTSARRIGSTGWVLVARLPTAEAFEPVADIKTRLFVALAGLGLTSLGLLWLVLRSALSPLHRATGRIQAMVDGNAELEALEVSRGDEIGRMIGAFNALQAKLAAADVALREREVLYHALFRGCKAVEMLIDPAEDGRIIDANHAAEVYYGWSHDQLLTMRISEINILDKAAIAAEMHKAELEERDHFDFRHRLASGEIRDVEVWSGPVQVTGRQLLYSIIHDVTARRGAEREVRSLLAFRRAVLDSAGSSIVATTVDGTIRLFNPTAERWLGYGAGEVVGRMSPADFHDPDEILARAARLGQELGRAVEPGFECFIAKVLDSGKPDSGEWTYVRKDGGRFRVLLTITALYDDHGELSGFLGIAQDISARLSVEKELKRSNAELEHFAYVASHDLRQPLRMISSYIALLQRRLGDALDQDCQDFIGFAVGGAQRMDHMITDLLQYSRIGRSGAAPAKVALGDVVSLSLANLGALIEEKGATVSVAEGLPVVLGNEVELERLFQNLISNAVKFQAEGRPPRVDVSWTATPDEWIISVSDNGIGIDEAGQQKLFQIFQRLVRMDQYPGSGIGLASCRKIAEHHGGRIWVESVPGEGSTFRVALPMPVARDG